MSKVGGRMKIKDHLSKGTRRKLNNLSKPNNKRKNKHNEKLSPYDLEDLMGTNRQTLKRGKGGAFKGK